MGNSSKHLTLPQLQKLFHVTDDRTIRSSFGDKIAIKNEIEVIEKDDLSERLGFDIDEPFMTFNEVMKELSINRIRLGTLERNGGLPYFQLKHAKGSAHMYLKKDVMAFKDASVNYQNSGVSHHLYTLQFRKLMIAASEFDKKFSHVIFKNDFDYTVYKRLFIENKSIDIIAKELKVSDQWVNNAVGLILKRIDTFLSLVQNISGEYLILKDENVALRQKLSECEKIISEYKRLPDTAEIVSDSATSICSAIANITINDLDLSVRLYGGLSEAKLTTLKDILECSTDDLYKLRNFGKGSANELNLIISGLGLKLNCYAKRVGIYSERGSIDTDNVFLCISKNGLTKQFWILANTYKLLGHAAN